jgi:GT2 family glycosyltransferase
METLTVIFVSFNSFTVLSKSLRPLVSDPTLRIIVIDNASHDGTIAQVRSQFSRVETVALKRNLGYGRAANVGLRQTITPYALLLNPDVFTTPSDIRRLLAFANSGTINAAIWGPPWKCDITDQTSQVVKRVRGSAMLFDVKKISEVGLFDENIFLYAEDDDLCERTIEAGYSLVACSGVYFQHLGGQSSPLDPKIQYMKAWHFGWSRCYYLSKHGRRSLYRNPVRKYLTYRIHNFLSVALEKRMKWQARADGARAFLQGESAFRADGTPQMS